MGGELRSILLTVGADRNVLQSQGPLPEAPLHGPHGHRVPVGRRPVEGRGEAGFEEVRVDHSPNNAKHHQETGPEEHKPSTSPPHESALWHEK
jgi:hypothetical protein